MDFGLSEEQELLQRSARELLAAECPPPLVREMMAIPEGFSRTLHTRMAELGWTGLIIPEKYGGTGLQLLEMALLAQEMGRAALPGPFFSSSVLAALTLLNVPGVAVKKDWLPRLAAGEVIGTLALLEESDRIDAEGVALRNVKTRDGYRLNGTKLFVTDAHVADFLIVATRGKGRGEMGVCLFLIPADTPGVS
ncbi:MAG TPA: acyl-CoA dehydrogenase family protein, partial [Terriglobales bacterium]|nr:acyl-CoA dehydrogenase family protein [Terriglobales bacterium]